MSGAASGRTRTASRRGAMRRRSAETSGVVRTTSPRKLVCTTSTAGAPVSLDTAGFIDEHDRDVVLYRIQELAAPADEPVLARGQRHLALALRTGEDLQQLLADGHGDLSSGLSRSGDPRAKRMLTDGGGGRRGRRRPRRRGRHGARAPARGRSPGELHQILLRRDDEAAARGGGDP